MIFYDYDHFLQCGPFVCSADLYTHYLPFSPPSFLASLIAPFPLLHFFILFIWCITNVLYVVIKQCQTQKRFINNIKQKVSSND